MRSPAAGGSRPGENQHSCELCWEQGLWTGLGHRTGSPRAATPTKVTVTAGSRSVSAPLQLPDLVQGCEKTGSAQAAKTPLDWEAGADSKNQTCVFPAFGILLRAGISQLSPRASASLQSSSQGDGSFSSVILLEMSLYLFLARRSSDKRTVGSYNYFKAK